MTPTVAITAGSQDGRDRLVRVMQALMQTSPHRLRQIGQHDDANGWHARLAVETNPNYPERIEHVD